MTINKTTENTSTVREFNYDFGFYYVDPLWNHIIIWHSCTKKPMLVLYENFESLLTGTDTCPNCQHPITKWETMDTENGHQRLYFYYIKKLKITASDNIITVTVTVAYYNLKRNATVFSELILNHEFSINVRTGYTRNLSRKTHGKEYNIIYNIMSFHLIPNNALKFLYKEICMCMKEFHGEQVPDFDSYNVDLSLVNLLHYVRNPYLCPVLYREIVDRSKVSLHNNLSAFRHNILFIKNTCTEPVQQIVKNSKIPNVKSLIKIAYATPCGIPLLSSLSYNFKNIDIIRNLYNVYSNSIDDCYGTYIDFSASIFKIMIMHKSESVIATKLINFKKYDVDNNAFRTLHDMINCYNKLKSCEFDFSGSYKIDELHLYLALTLSKREKTNKKIVYNNVEKALEMFNDNFSISLVKDTYELINIGLQMDICVGSYASNVVKKRCTIMVLTNLTTNKPVGCIEMNDEKYILQVKGKRNKLLKGNDKDFVLQWIKNNDLIDYTNDL